MNASILYAAVVWLFAVGIYQSNKPLPHGIDFESEPIHIAADQAELLTDLTALSAAGDTVHQHEIFDSVFAYIEAAEKYILLDMFLFNSYTGPSGWIMRDLSGELTQLLIAKKRASPDIQIDLISDPVNIFYGGSISPEFQELEANGINVIITDLTKLRDSAPLYSSVWRTFIQWFGNTNKFGILPHPFDSGGKFVTLRSYLEFINLKANHRKICIVDSPEGPVSFVLSANPHSASSDFSNVGIMVKGEFAHQLYETENTVASISDGGLRGNVYLDSVSSRERHGDYNIQILTEEKIKDRLMSNINGLMEGDTMYICMFYFSNRDIIRGLIQASHRGAFIKMVLDPNKDGFGYPRSGIPNQVIAGELIEKSSNGMSIRWYLTNGEEFHSKLMLVIPAEGEASLILGSANYTRKNLNNFNLELDVCVESDKTAPIMVDSRAYFEKMWNNQDYIYTVDYEKFENTGFFRTLQYRFQETFGLGIY